ncbi:MAG: peptidylprolyl isomerase [Treponema sp.]|jgi:parvulin-like peptidyl-prolyl isomerase|nr:peptidylprolyl isomerase [Treponema sp.]
MAKNDKNDKKAPVVHKARGPSEDAKKFKQRPAIYIGSIFILVLVTVTFIGGDFITGGGFGRGSGDYFTFGYYDNAPISYVAGNVFAQYQQNNIMHYQSQGIDVNNRYAAQQIWRQSYETAIVHTAILQIMKRSNYSAPEKSVDRAVAQFHYQNNGRFSRELYNRTPEASRLATWRQTQEELTKTAYFKDLFALLVPDAEADFMAAMSSPMRSFDMVSFKVDDYPEMEYLSYAHENASLFGTIHLSKITVNNEREARKILASVKDGTLTFEDAARAQSQDSYADRGGDMGSRYCYEVDQEITNLPDRQAIYALGRGEISDIISVTDGWVFYRVENELAPAEFEDSSVMDRVRSYIRNYARGRMEDWALDQARAFIDEAKEYGFNDTVRRRYMGKQSFGPLPLNYGGIELFPPSLESFTIESLSSEDKKNLSGNEEFWRIAFSTELNTPSEPMVQGSNILVFFPTEEVEVDEETVKNTAAMYASTFLNYIAEQSLQYYFLQNSRMDDRFREVYSNNPYLK